MKVTRLSTSKVIKLAGEEGFEPSLTGPEPAVLPLDDPPVTDGVMCITPIVQSKSGPLPGLLNTIRPLPSPCVVPPKSSGDWTTNPEFVVQPPNLPIISPHPADYQHAHFSIGRTANPIFNNFRHGSLVAACFPSWLYTSAAEGSLAYPCPSGTIEVGR